MLNNIINIISNLVYRSARLCRTKAECVLSPSIF